MRKTPIERYRDIGISAIIGTSSRYRQMPVTPPTPEQVARRERVEWNAAVDRRKAERNARRAPAQEPGEQKGESNGN